MNINEGNNILKQPELKDYIIKPMTELSFNIAKYAGLFLIKEISKITGINLKNQNIANVLAEINKALDNPETQKQVKDLKADEPQQKIGTQNNVVFAGSTADLFKMLKNKDDGKTIEQ